MKKKRFMGKLKKKEQLEKTEDGYTCCRWCNKAVYPPRRTMCSASCAHEIKLRTNHRYLKTCVYKRDRAICALCGEDTKKIAKQYFLTDSVEQKTELLLEKEISLKRKIYKRKYGGGLWDADHIIPVKDGGGQCGLENIRTLCIRCHKKITFSKK